jgi:tape measure domain-containing protein
MDETARLVIEVDSTGFLKAEGNAKVFESLLNKIQGTATKTEKSVKGLGDNFAAFQLIVNKLPGPLKSIVSGMLGMVSPATAAIGAVIELTEAAVNFAKGSLQAFSDFEMIQANLEIVTGSATEASATFNQLRDMAGQTPFDVEGLANAAVQIRQTGTAASDLIPTLTLLGNVAGGSSEKFNRIVANFAQIQSVGKATAMDIRQFAMMGIPIMDTFKQMGVTGTGTAQEVQEAFQLMAGEGGKFFNAMGKGAETLQGKTANLEGTWKSFKATFAEATGLDKLWKDVLDAVTTVLTEQTNVMNENMNVKEAQKAIDEGSITTANLYTVAMGKLNQEKRNFKALLRENGITEEELIQREKQQIELLQVMGLSEEEIETHRKAGLIAGLSLAKERVKEQEALLEPYKKEYEFLQKNKKSPRQEPVK